METPNPSTESAYTKEDTMDGKNVYAQLREFMDTLPTGFPETPSGVEIRILRKLFTPEEAGLFLHLKEEPETVETIADRLGIDTDELAQALADMADKGLVFRERGNGRPLYRAFQFIIGIYEFQLNTLDRELAEMIEEYFPHFGMALAGAGVKTKQLRVAPVKSSIDAASSVAHYNQIRDLIREQEVIAVQDCICRKEQGLLGNRCEHPHDVCFSFGSFGQYYIDNKLGRRIDADEAMTILDKAEEAGLVLSPSNTKELVALCSCCPCCCPTIRFAKMMPRPADMFKTYYRSRIEADYCTLCQTCIERCPMDAIQEGVDASEVIDERCIGCGLCVSACPEEAISLLPLPGVAPPPEDMEAVFQQIKIERGL